MQIRAAKLPAPEREYKFSPVRRFRFDFAWPDLMLAVEIDGATRRGTNGGHTSGDGYARDREKDNLAADLGWRLVRSDSTFLRTGRLLQYVEKLIEERTAHHDHRPRP